MMNDLYKTSEQLHSTFSAVTTVSWCFLTASCENSDVANKHMLSSAKYL